MPSYNAPAADGRPNLPPHKCGAWLCLPAQPALLGIGVCHWQQAAEKALKGFLTARSTPFPHTHDLVRLIALCEGVDPAFARFLATGQTLNPYATLFRYPGGPLAPPTEEAEDAVQLADHLLRFVRQNL